MENAFAARAGSVIALDGHKSARSEGIPLPPLREDLKLLEGASTLDGRPTWTVHDPARHRFLRIGWLEFEILSRWRLGRSDRIVDAINAGTTIRATESDVVEVLEFTSRAGLLITVGPAAQDRLIREVNANRLSAPKWLLKNYLFLRVRLFNPDRFLDRLWSGLRWIFTPGFAVLLGALALLGFYLISRQWEAYRHSFLNLFSLEGAFFVGLALSFAKVFHEIGHGVMSKRFGLRVPGMGVALLVLWPVLWTDTTDAWRLTDRRQRMAIDAAGMLAEIALAIFASLAWSLLPDGSLRTGAFLLSSSTWLVTVAVNVNPLMRFDGYYLLSDLIDVPNMQDRAFALARWRMREFLFGLGAAPPERFGPTRYRILLAYAFCTWIYRFSLFLGIALLVYHFAFKALGIFLGGVEVWWFLARPIVTEIRLWGRHLHGRWSSPQLRRSLVILAGLCVLLILPWHSHISAPGLMRAERQAALYTAEAGRIVQIARNGTRVEPRQTLFTLRSPDIDYRLAKAKADLDGIQRRLAGQSFDPEGIASLQVSYEDMARAQAELTSAQTAAQSLVVHAPFAGTVTDIPPTLRSGEWLPRRENLGILLDPSTQLVEAYVSEADLARIAVGDTAVFFSENGEIRMPLAVAAISPVAITNLQVPELASPNGGGIAVRKENDGTLVPESAVYRVLLRPREPLAGITLRLRGTVEISGARESLIHRIYQRAVAILIREGGF